MNNEFIQAVKDLCNKLDEIDTKSNFHQIFFVASLHGTLYNGPNYSSFLEEIS